MNQLINKIKRFSEPVYFYTVLAFYYFFSITELTMYIKVSAFVKVSKICRYLIYLYWAYTILIHLIDDLDLNLLDLKDTFKKMFDYLQEHLVLVLFTIVALCIFIFTHSLFPMCLVLLLWSSDYYHLNSMIKVYFGVGLGVMIFAWASQLQGILPEVLIFRNVDLRYSFGYMYPLEFMTHFLFMVMAYFYLNRNHIETKDLVMINMMNMLIYKITDSRSSFYLILMISILAFACQRLPLDQLVKKIPSILFYLLIAFCFIAPVVIAMKYDPTVSWMAKLNDALSSRISYSISAIQNYGLSIFGKSIHWIGSGGSTNYQKLKDVYNFVDCAYIKILLDYGIIFYMFIFGGTMLAMKNILSLKNPSFLIVCIYVVVLVISLLEPRLLSISINPFILFYRNGLMIKNPKIIQKA